MTDTPAPEEDRPRPALPPLLLGFAAFTGGLGTMALEMTSVRVMAPWFGTSFASWTNVIGVFLACLAAGNLLGGRLADRWGGLRPAGAFLGVGGALAALAPLLLPPCARLFVDPELPLEAALGAMVAASLPTTALLFGPPVVLLGMIPPFLVKGWAGGDPGRVGRASGIVYALGTAGSLAGTFLPQELIPLVGSQLTIVLCAAPLVLAGLTLLGARPAPALLLLLPVLIAGWAQTSVPLAPPPREGGKTLWERESHYQYARVVERREKGRKARFLLLNEGLDSFHSVALAGRRTTGGRYYDALCLAPLLGEMPLERGSSFLSLGTAGGTCMRLLEDLYGPGLDLTGVEIDPVCVEAGREFLDLPRSARIHAGVDARLFVNRAGGSWRLIIVDAYAAQIYIPFQLATVEFFTRLRDLLEEGGVVAVNVADPSPTGLLARPLARSMAAACGGACLFPLPRSRNYMVVARRGGEIEPERLLGKGCPPALRPLAERLARPGAWEMIRGEPPLLTDDRCPLEQLTRRAYAAAREWALRP